jgi:hypothetical protein
MMCGGGWSNAEMETVRRSGRPPHPQSMFERRKRHLRPYWLAVQSVRALPLVIIVLLLATWLLVMALKHL